MAMDVQRPQQTQKPPQLRLQEFGYQLSQGLRAAWFAGHYVLTARLSPPVTTGRPGAVASESSPKTKSPSWQYVRADLQQLFARDWANIEAGLYPAPDDMLPEPISGLRKSIAFFRDLGEVNRRKSERAGQEVFQKPWRGRYPRYYLQNFHYQSGGYLTDDSARLYDYQVEVLFSGGADAMRRQALPPIRRHLRETGLRSPRLLDVACGTGRFLASVKDAFPRLRAVGLDLSLPYLAESKRLLAGRSRTQLAQGLAEALPFPASSFDIVTSVFLFHELPRKVRRDVAKEMARVLRPGGLCVFVDSIQRGDHPPYNPLLDRFPQAMHEPYYAGYVEDDLADVFGRAGLKLQSVERAFFSRVMVLAKPA